MEFFDGKNFEKIRPSQTDLKTITKYLAKIHLLRFKINRNYDPWGTVNLIKEFLDKKGCLTHQDLRLIEPIVNDFRRINFNKFRKCIIHGDIQRKHILKDKKGNYCILDFGFMDFNAAVIDLAIFIALFCFDVNSSVKDNRKVYSTVVKEYTKTNTLNRDEISSLPLLVRATYAIYTIGSSYLFFPKNDKSVQTKKWLAFGRKGLRLRIF